MRITDGADVVSAEGKKLGSVARVVVDARTKEVTHLVVGEGLVFTEEKVVPLNLVAGATDARITLQPDAGELEDMSEFEVDYFVPADEAADEGLDLPVHSPPAFYVYPPFLGTPGGPLQVDPRGPSVVAERRIPFDTVPLEEGATVLGYGGHKVGEVAGVLTHPGDNRLSHMLVRQGTLRHHEKLVPAEWIEAMDEDQVRLAVSAGTVNTLRDYES